MTEAKSWQSDGSLRFVGWKRQLSYLNISAVFSAIQGVHSLLNGASWVEKNVLIQEAHAFHEQAKNVIEILTSISDRFWTSAIDNCPRVGCQGIVEFEN